MSAGKRYVSINGHTIRKNAVLKTAEPPIRIAKTPSDAKPSYASGIAILDAANNVVARLVYSPESPRLRCGARLVLECDNMKVIA